MHIAQPTTDITSHRNAQFFKLILLKLQYKDQLQLRLIMIFEKWVNRINPMLLNVKCLSLPSTSYNQGWASVLFKRTFRSLRYFAFFIKERSVLCVLLRSL